MTLRSKVYKLEQRANASREEGRKAFFPARFLDAHSRGMVLCKDGIERPFEEWAKLRGIYEQLYQIQDEGEAEAENE